MLRPPERFSERVLSISCGRIPRSSSLKLLMSDCNKRTARVGVFIMGETVPGGRNMGTQYFLLSFAGNLKLLFKNKVLKNKM